VATRNLSAEDEASYTITDFCLLEKFSEATYHNLKKKGFGPAEMRAPGTRIVRITAQARRDWQERMQKLALTPQIAEQKRKEAVHTSKGGKIAAASLKHSCRAKARKAAARKAA
jgi:hypothetical protein